jgi:putative transposase
MGTSEALPRSQRWSQTRFAVIGGLLTQAPSSGSLRQRLCALAEQHWVHPITGLPVRFSAKTIERWYYAALGQPQPTAALVRRIRSDAGAARALSPEVIAHLRKSHAQRPDWTYLLHYDNLRAQLGDQAQEVPSYTTVWRFMRANGLVPSHHPADAHHTASAQVTRARFANREVRSFEHTHTHALWHIDAHHGRLSLSHEGRQRRPVLIALIDDHSRLILHAQWFQQEHARTAAHVLIQGITKHGLPRALLSDNGGPFVCAEIRHGLHRLGIHHETTLCYAPNQNGKMEVFWGQVEGRLVAMLRGMRDLDLYSLNELTQAWIEHDYHRRVHAGISATPLQRYVDAPHAGRDTPASDLLRHAFTRRETRRQRRSDGTISLCGRRLQIPSRYRHQVMLIVRYASWDLDHVYLAHHETDAIMERLYPVDRSGNADGARAALEAVGGAAAQEEPGIAEPENTLPPLLAQALSATRATGMPPAFIPLEDDESTPPPPPCTARIR